MNIHEYQAKELLAKFGVPVPAGFAAMSVEEAVAAAGTVMGMGADYILRHYGLDLSWAS